MHTSTSSNPTKAQVFRLHIPFGESRSKPTVSDITPQEKQSPFYKKLLDKAASLDRLSKYKSTFDYGIYNYLEKRFSERPVRGGVVFRSPFKLINYHASCEECLYAFMIDTYGRGCVHDCLYCYAKAELTVHGYWNKPFPMPVDINSIRNLFYTIFETNKRSKWRTIMERRIPLRIGYASDSFMWMDSKYKVTKELLNILKYYKYPYIIATRSDLVAHDDYVELLDKDRSAIQMSIISTDDLINRKLEPGAPSAKRRLRALEKLSRLGFWTTVRLNPLFPIYPDGYYTTLPKPAAAPQLTVFQWNMIQEIAEYKVPSLLAGFGRFSPYALNLIEKTLRVDFRSFFRGKKFSQSRDYNYSDLEIRYYYERLKELCDKHNLEFTTCYIGNHEPHFWKDQDLWSNKHDCCNAKGRVATFSTDTQMIPFSKRGLLSNTTKSKCTATSQRMVIDIRSLLKNADNPFLKV